MTSTPRTASTNPNSGCRIPNSEFTKPHPNNAPLILASASPRRLELLSMLGIPYKAIPSQAEESGEGGGCDLVMNIARVKCADVFAQYPHCFVLAADTLVCVDGETLGKPIDEADAALMLRKLSGRWHEVHTGLCMQGPGYGPMVMAETTKVEFVTIPAELIGRYIETGEPMDKAGAYAMQGFSGMFVSRVEGSPSNVIGFPLHLVGKLLMDAGYVPLSAPERLSNY